MEQITDNEIGDMIKSVMENRGSDWSPVIVMMADYLSSIDQRLAKVEALAEKLDSGRDANPNGGLSIG